VKAISAVECPAGITKSLCRFWEAGSRYIALCVQAIGMSELCRIVARSFPLGEKVLRGPNS
jgi:hypothetical protein